MSDSQSLSWIVPDWPAPPWVCSVVTTRCGGVSAEPYSSFNLAEHVGDDPFAVAHNRKCLNERFKLPSPPRWLSQVHGIDVVDAALIKPGCIADASHSDQAGAVCAVLTADCLPVLLCHRERMHVAAAHAGWRGLAQGVLASAVHAMQVPPGQIMAWLGPAIGPSVFEVGEEVYRAFTEQNPAWREAFKPTLAGRWLADLYQLARWQLHKLGVTAVYGGHWCTYTDAQRFYSYRRDGVTGRMASLIWMKSQ